MDDTKSALKHGYLSTFDRILIPRSSLKLNCRKLQLAWGKFVHQCNTCETLYHLLVYHLYVLTE